MDFSIERNRELIQIDVLNFKLFQSDVVPIVFLVFIVCDSTFDDVQNVMIL